MESQTNTSRGDYGYETVLSLSDDDPDQAVYADYDEQDY